MSERRPNVFGVSRDLWDHPLFAAEPYTEREAWAWLIGAAAWKRIHTRGNVGQVTLDRGEFSFAIRFLAEKWQWDKSRVHRFVGRLLKNEMLKENKRDSNQVFSISNYGRFQVVGVGKRDSDETATRHGRDADETLLRQQRDKEETGETLNIETGEVRLSSAGADVPASLPIIETVEAEIVSRETKQPDLLGDIPEFLRRTKPAGDPPPPVVVVATFDPIERAMEAYHRTVDYVEEHGGNWARCVQLSNARRNSLKLRLEECGGLQGWCELMAQAAKSSFLTGKAGRSNGHENWKVGLDFFLQPKTFNKLREGSYDDAPGNSNGGGADALAQGFARAAAAYGD